MFKYCYPNIGRFMGLFKGLWLNELIDWFYYIRIIYY